MLFQKTNDSIAEPSDGLFRATREIAAYFTEKNVKFDVRRADNMSVLETGMRGTNVNAIKLVFISRDDDSDVAIRSFNITPKIPEDKKSVVLEAMNKLNSKYRFVKFALDDDGAISVSYDVPTSAGEVGGIAFEMLVRLVKIIDESYPELMKAIWS